MPQVETPSNSNFRAIRDSALKALRRFPFVLLAAALATGIAISWLFHSHGQNFDEYFLFTGRILILALLGIPWLYSLSVFAERRRERGIKIWLPLLGIGALLLYYIRLGRLLNSEVPEPFFFELAALWFGLHFLAAYAPFIGVEEPRGFWEYNRSLFLRFLLALLFSVTLWIGIGLFFGLLNLILGKDLSMIYWVAALIILGIFNTWFFLAGVPEDWQALQREPRPYPRALKFFAQFVLVPLVVLILLGMEIVFLQALARPPEPPLEPQIWIATAFLLLGGFGLLTFLLLFPLSLGSGRNWLQYYRRGLAIALLPPLLWLAYQTIDEVRSTGWTPSHYYLLLLSAWGIGMGVYLATVRHPKIQWIPMSLSLLAGISVLPLVGAASFTRRSQENHLAALFDQSGLKLGEPDLGKIVALPEASRGHLSNRAELLRKNSGCEALRPFFGEDIDKTHLEDCRSERLRAALNPDAGPRALEDAGVKAVRLNFNLKERSNPGVTVEGFSYYFPENGIERHLQSKEGATCAQDATEPTLCVVFDQDKQSLDFFLDRKPLGKVELPPTLQSLVSQHAAGVKQSPDGGENYYSLTERELSFDYPLPGHKLRLLFTSLFLEKRDERVSASAVNFSVLLK
jgi:hypothetical protein